MTVSKTAQSKDLSFRTANLSDIAHLEKLVHLAYRGGKATVAWKNEDHLVKGPRITAAELKELVESNTAAIMLAEMPGNGHSELVGCVLVEDHGTDAHIGLLAVSPDCQNMGIGKKLICAAETYAHHHFKQTIAKMCVLSGREELLGWYKSLGYKETGKTEPFPGADSGLQTANTDAHFIEISKNIQAR